MLRFSGVFGFAGARNEMVVELASRRLVPQGTPPRSARLEGRRCLPLADRKALPSTSLGQAFEAASRRLRTRSLMCGRRSAKSCAKGAAKRLKSLACVNLCAPTALYDWSKLALGPASASALPTSSPSSSIEVCSRIERSSPFACRSACSGERATLTVTFDSTSGCR
jgi:hypothetical protein